MRFISLPSRDPPYERRIRPENAQTSTVPNPCDHYGPVRVVAIVKRMIGKGPGRGPHRRSEQKRALPSGSIYFIQDHIVIRGVRTLIKLVVFDMDGTLTRERSSWETLFKAFDHDSRPFHQRYVSGELDEDGWASANMRAILDSRPGLRSSEAGEAIVKGTHFREGFPELVAELRKRDIRCAIISSGMEPIARVIGTRADLHLWKANWFLTDDNDLLLPTYVRNVTFLEKDEWIKRWREQYGLRKEEIVSVGDGLIDICMFQQSGHSIAFDPMDDRVSIASEVVHEGNDLRVCLETILNWHR